jgi:hypothetical protein
VGTAPDFAEKPGAFRRFMAELVTEDSKSGRRVAKASCDLFRGELFNEVAAKGFVLAVERSLGRKEELSFGGRRYSISSTDRHKPIMLPKADECQ